MTSDEKKRALRAQIRANKAIQFTYQNKNRVGDPYTLGISNKKYAVRLYQTSGFSESGLKRRGSPDDFRFFYLEDIDNIVERNTVFKINPAYQENDEAFTKIDTQVTK